MTKNVKALVSALFALILGLSSFSFIQNAFSADSEQILTPPYASPAVEWYTDGTGHGTDQQTFINSKNGYRVADDTEKDGVVASGDLVRVRAKVSFQAAKSRSVAVGLDLSEAPYLELSTPTCPRGALVGEARSQGSERCVYSVPTGVSESLTVDFALNAKDTEGLIKSGQKVYLYVKRMDGATERVPVREFTVVSAPAADLTLSEKSYYNSQNFTYIRTDKQDDALGRFSIGVSKLHFAGYNYKGSSTKTEWSAKVDVSNFPEGTTFSSDGSTLTPTNGVLSVSGKGHMEISFRIPHDKAMTLVNDGVYSWDVSIKTDKNVFATSDGVLNLGVGGEPGGDKDANFSTQNDSIGSKEGSLHKNNNYTTLFLAPKASDTPDYFSLDVLAPRGSHYTLFDDENKLVSSGSSMSSVKYGDSNRVATGTQLKHLMTARVARMSLTAGSTFSMEYTWDSSEQQFNGSLDIVQGSRYLAENRDYTVKWKDKSGALHDGYPGDRNTGVEGLVITVKADSIDTSEEAPEVYASFLTKVTEEYSAIGDNRVHSTFTGSSTYPVPEVDLASINVVEQGDQSLYLNFPDSYGERALQLGETKSTWVMPYIRNIHTLKQPVSLDLKVKLPKYALDVVSNSGEYSTKIVDEGGTKYLVAHLTDSSRAYDTKDGYSLPDLNFSFKVGNLASKKLTFEAQGTAVASGETLTSSTTSKQFSVIDSNQVAGQISSAAEKVDYDTDLVYDFNFISRGADFTGTSTNVIKLPSNNDSGMTGDNNTGLDGSWNEYDLGSSHFTGSYALSSPVSIDANNSSDVTVEYSTQDINSLNPDDYTWRVWDDIPPSERASIRAVKLTSSFRELEGSQKVASSSGRIIITPTGNADGDEYNVWVSRNILSNSSNGNTTPFPAKTYAKSSSISGVVWWDNDGSANLDDSEDVVSGVNVKLFSFDSNGVKSAEPVATTKTGDDGRYVFENLKSGKYSVEVERQEGKKTETGVQTKVDTYFGETKDVTVSYSMGYSNGEFLSDTGTFSIKVGQNLGVADFGFLKPDPKATLDKQASVKSCNSTECTLEWKVALENSGTTTDPARNFTASSKTVDNSSGVTASIRNDGVYLHGTSWRVPGATQNPDQKYPVRLLEGKFTDVAVFAGNVYAVDDNGDIVVYGNNNHNGLLGIGAGENGQPADINGPGPNKVVKPEGVTFTNVAASGDDYYGVYALSSDGDIYAWGQGWTNNYQPTKLNLPGKYRLLSVEPGDDANVIILVIDTDNNLYHLETLTDSNEPLLIPLNPGVKYLTATSSVFTYSAVRIDGSTVDNFSLNNELISTHHFDGMSISKTATLIRPNERNETLEDVFAVDNRSGQLVRLMTCSLTEFFKNRNFVCEQDGSAVQHKDSWRKFKDVAQSDQDNYFYVISSNGAAFFYGYQNTFVNFYNGTVTQPSVQGYFSYPGKDSEYSQDPDYSNPNGWVDNGYISALVPKSPKEVVDSNITSGTNVIPAGSKLYDVLPQDVYDVKVRVKSENSDDYTYVYPVGSFNETRGYATSDIDNSNIERSGIIKVSDGKQYYLLLDNPGSSEPGYLLKEAPVRVKEWSNYFLLGEDGYLYTDPSRTQDFSVNKIDYNGTKFKQIATDGNYVLAEDGSLYRVTSSDGFKSDSQFTKITDGVQTIGSDSGTKDAPHGDLFILRENSTTIETYIKSSNSFADVYDLGKVYPEARFANNFTRNWASYLQLDYNHVLAQPTTKDEFTLYEVHGIAESLSGNYGTIGIDGNGKVVDLAPNNYRPVDFSDVNKFVVDKVGFVRAPFISAHTVDGKVVVDLKVRSYDSDPYEGIIKSLEEVGFTYYEDGGYFVLDERRTGKVYVSAGILFDKNTGELIAFSDRDLGRIKPSSDVVWRVPANNSDSVSLEPTSVSVESSSSTTKREYTLPFDVHPGGGAYFTITAKVDKREAERVVGNQAWFESESVSYSKSPTAKSAGVMSPTRIDISSTQLSANGDIGGNATCKTGADFVAPSLEHIFTSKAEDLCDQSGFKIEAISATATEEVPVKGIVQGFLFDDADGDGVFDEDSEQGVSGSKVYLINKTTGEVIKTEVTWSDSTHVTGPNQSMSVNGFFQFNAVPEGEYYVKFAPVEGKRFTTPKASTGSGPASSITSTVYDGSEASDSGLTWDPKEYGASPSFVISRTGSTTASAVAGVVNSDSSLLVSMGLDSEGDEDYSVKSNGAKVNVPYNEPQRVWFAVTNTGSERLIDVDLAHSKSSTRDDVENVTCHFTQAEVNGVTRNVLSPGETVVCEGDIILTATGDKGIYSGSATASGWSEFSLMRVSDTDSMTLQPIADVTHGSDPSYAKLARIPSTGSYFMIPLGVCVLLVFGTGVYVIVRKDKDGDSDK